jgi:hypothetical protein
MNRKRLAISAFVVGAVATTILFYKDGSWHEMFHRYEFFQANESSIEADERTIIDHHDNPASCVNLYGTVLLRRGPDACDSEWLAEDKTNSALNHSGKVGAAWGIVLGVVFVFAGAALASAVGYLLPSLSRLVMLVLGRWVPWIVMAYIRWIREPEAKH